MADGTTAESIKVLIASDLHQGYAELDPIRGNDSFDTFDEILGLANQHQVTSARMARAKRDASEDEWHHRS